jgi:hypothetical protein
MPRRFPPPEANEETTDPLVADHRKVEIYGRATARRPTACCTGQ